MTYFQTASESIGAMRDLALRRAYDNSLTIQTRQAYSRLEFSLAGIQKSGLPDSDKWERIVQACRVFFADTEVKDTGGREAHDVQPEFTANTNEAFNGTR